MKMRLAHGTVTDSKRFKHHWTAGCGSERCRAELGSEIGPCWDVMVPWDSAPRLPLPSGSDLQGGDFVITPSAHA